MIYSFRRDEGLKKGPALVLLIEKVPLPYPITLTIVGIAMLLVELVISVSINISWVDFFWQFPLIPVTIIAVPYVMAVLCWAWKTYEPMLKSIGESFAIEESQFLSTIENYLQKEVYNDSNWLMACLVTGVPFVIISDMVVLTTEYIQWPLLKVMFSQPLTLANIVVLESMLAFLLSIAAYLMFIHSRFMKKLASFPIQLNILEPNRSKLESIAKFSLKGAFAYFLGISVATALAVGPSLFFVVIEVLLFMLGLILFFMPLYALHKSIKKAKLAMLSTISQKFKKEFDEGKDYLKILTFCIVFNEVEKIREWPFTPTILNQLLVSAFMPFITWIIKILAALLFSG